MNQPHSSQLFIYTDGGSRGNPGPAASAFVVTDEKKTLVFQCGYSLGVATNNEAEYVAFLASLEWVKNTWSKVDTNITWKLDSLLVVEQLNKRWKVKDRRMAVLAQKAWAMLESLQWSWKITHIPREENTAADALVNATLDAAAKGETVLSHPISLE